MLTPTPHREILWNVSSPYNIFGMYLIFFLSLAICLNGFWQRFLVWSAGTKDNSRLNSWNKRFLLLWKFVVAQKKVNRQKIVRVFHGMVLWGFLVLLFTTTMVFLDHDLGFRIYQGSYYLAVTLLSDIFGLALLLGILIAFHLRYKTKPDRLHNTDSDMFMLSMLALMVIQGFVLEGLRIHATNDPWSSYSPIGLATSFLFWQLSITSTSYLHFSIWWFHALTVFAFIALLPYSKFFHIISSSANLFFQNLSRPKGALQYPGDIEKLLEQAVEEAEGEFKIGLDTITDFTWKQRLDLDACTSCGRCQEVCPAYNSGKALSPKWLILDCRDHLLSLKDSDFNLWQRLDKYLLNKFLLAPRFQSPEKFSLLRANNPLVQQSANKIGLAKDDSIAGLVMAEDVFWSCTTCRACVEVCPVGIEHVDLITDVRRSLTLMQSKLPNEAQTSIKAIETRGNPFGSADSRFDWAQGLSVPVLQTGDSVNVLYWVGCVSAFDKRKQSIARSMVNILNRSGLKWGVLGNKECCTGDPARRLGEENIFQSLAKKNLETLKSFNFEKIVANCPHCFNTLKNEYSDIDHYFQEKNISIVHHSHFIQELLAKGLIQLKQGLEESVTFHDPCYLGRYNETYNEPREILVKIGGLKLTEMSNSREKAMCCGAGGGHFWMDMKVGQRVNVLRTNQAAETSATTVATGCPFCMQMLEDGIKLTQKEEELKVKDIAEFVSNALL